MSIWFKHDAHFHEHPKCLRLRRLAGAKADSAEVGWWRIVAAAKRFSSWSFEDEEHLRDAAGRYAGFLNLYREVGLLDHLTIHNAAEYQSYPSPAERQRVSRATRDTCHNSFVTGEKQAVTDVTPRVEKSREERVEQNARDEDDDKREDLEAFLLVTRRAPTPRQRQLLDGLLDRHDLTGPKWAADIMLRNPSDPIGAVIEADKAWRAERIAEAQAKEKPKPQPRRSRGLPATTRDILRQMEELRREPGDAA